jgi:hypothetical protein
MSIIIIKVRFREFVKKIILESIIKSVIKR